MLWFLVGISLVGTVANIYKRRVGFLLWMISNGMWAVVDWVGGLPEQAALFAVYFFLAVWGFIKWEK